MKASKKEFIAEAEDLLFECQQCVLEIQDTYLTAVSPDTINALFRSMHTLKGLSGLFGNQGITDISHALESLLDDMRLGKVPITEDVVNFLFKSIDTLSSAINGLKEDTPVDLLAHIEEIRNFRVSMQAGEQGLDIQGIIDERILRVLSEYEEHRLKANIKTGNGIYLFNAIFDLSTFDTSLEEVTKKIKGEGELISTLPTSTGVPEGSIGFNLMFASNQNTEAFKQHFSGNIEVLVPAKHAEPQIAAKQDHTVRSATTTVRVDIDKLDRILNTIGELTLAKDAVKRIGAEIEESYPYSPLIRDIHKISVSFERRLGELQDEVLAIRMVPIGQIFSRLAQVIRRYSRETGKEIDLTLYGEDTEVDKSIAEEIIDPLMHLVRNSIDHGIESAEERLAKGKREHGTIVLKAAQKGNHVVIEVIDDGRGIDIAEVRTKAIEKGLIEPDAKIEDREVLDFVFAPGFSTKNVVSEISGRGVGMDIVKEKLSVLGGFTEIRTKKNEGTTITLTLPITLAIIRALLVRAGKHRFAIPLSAISEIIVIELKDIQTIEWKNVYYLRGEMLPIIDVGKIFLLETDKNDQTFAVVVGFGRRKLGVVVDEIIAQHEIVIKSLGNYLKGISGFAGAAEIGRHEVILVLDVESIIEQSLTRQEGASYV
ncbi:MAG: chemotaxis protein CheA [Thermodesulfovibrionales bacterium]|nr:chemotaxis protein CheA [Thermodesulfovibrionales bacterium]